MATESRARRPSKTPVSETEKKPATLRLVTALLGLGPLEAERCCDIELTDDNGTLIGRFPPIVRKPICKFPSGRLALGMGDVIVTNDPITGQGANTASKASTIYLQRILEYGHKPFDSQWMHQTFDLFWDYAQWVVKWTNSLLIQPEPQISELLATASRIPALARKIANGFNHPPDYYPWWFESAEAGQIIEQPIGDNLF
jgi:hypothetical protein